jgi:hypothetical protein
VRFDRGQLDSITHYVKGIDEMIVDTFYDCKFLAVLDTMWGDHDQAPSWFPINPMNLTGKRLYRLTKSKFPEVWVTNACRECVSHADKHGKPDTEWLLNNLNMIPNTLIKTPLLICGGTAQKTYAKIVDPVIYHKRLEVFMPHPAYRKWTNEKLNDVTDLIEMYIKYNQSNPRDVQRLIIP